MNTMLYKFLLIGIIITILGCNTQKKAGSGVAALFQSDQLVINQISNNTFQHISYKQTNDFGNVPCNGLIVRSSNKVIIFDTPTNDSTATALIQWITNTLHCTIIAVIPTHFHDDCLGGLQAFHNQNIPSFANAKTIELAGKNKLIVPQNSFTDSLVMQIGDKKVIARYFGEGHTKDNIVGYFPAEDVLFGGCLIKEIGATKGYLGDANLTQWSATVEKVKQGYPNVKFVIPGHGRHGNRELLDYTINLFKPKK